jgi:hypothetical protein
MVKIPSAYCFEIDAISPGDIAVYNRDHNKLSYHYFCASKDCAFPVKPFHTHSTGVAWFTSMPIAGGYNHITGCPHRVGTSADDYEGPSGPYEPDESERFIVPTVLRIQKEKLIRQWSNKNPPSREEIAIWASKAKQAPVYGDLETVINAYETIKKGERPNYKIYIDNNKHPYNEAVQWIGDLPRPWNVEEWNKHIVLFYCSVVVGKVPGVFFLNAHLREKDSQQAVRTSCTVRMKDKTNDLQRKHLSSLLEQAAAKRERVKLYWKGPMPAANERGFVLTGDDNAGSCFAIRPLSPGIGQARPALEAHQQTHTRSEIGVPKESCDQPQ